MLESFPIVLLTGTVLGFLTGLGIGGGSLLIIWLTMVLGTDPLTARCINLLFFIPSAVIACIFRIRQGTLQIRSVLPAILSGCTAAAAFSWLSAIVDVALLKKLFGFVLIAAGTRELFFKEKKQG